jgi:hypothetical protein
VAVVDPLDLWSISPRLEGLGHEVVKIPQADLILAAHLDRTLLAEVERGASLVLLARSGDAVAHGLDLAIPIVVRSRRPGDEAPLAEQSWEGDWISVFAWALPGLVAGLPEGGLLGDAQADIFPDHVLDGLEPATGWEGVDAGMFSGWVRTPAALLVAFRQGEGHLIATTLRVAPEDGPVATDLLEALVQRASRAVDRRDGAAATAIALDARTRPR